VPVPLTTVNSVPAASGCSLKVAAGVASTRRPDTASKCWYHVLKSPPGARPASWKRSAM
jgi:hypothetical protein